MQVDDMKPVSKRMTFPAQVVTEPRINDAGQLHFNVKDSPESEAYQVVIKPKTDLALKWGESLEKGDKIFISGHKHVMKNDPQKFGAFVADKGEVVTNQARLAAERNQQMRRQGLSL